MANIAQPSRIFNIPAGTGFAAALTQQILREVQHAPHTLPDWRIFLPTRRACRTLQDAFLDQSGGKPLLLPRLLTLGDVEDDALMLAMAAAEHVPGALDLLPPLSALDRRMLLARLVAEQHAGMRPAQALRLADALGHLMDQIYTEGLDLNDLAALVPAELAAHWQITLDFLTILGTHWPRILAAHNVMDAADRRNRLMRALARHWQDNPPQTPVIAAGSTGTIPATALLLRVILGLPQGRIVLPGLDQAMPTEDWNAIEEGHPQAGLKHLLQTLESVREDIAPWPGTENAQTCAGRAALARHMMCPAQASAQWVNLGMNLGTNMDKTQQSLLQQGLQGLQIAQCQHAREEADVIAVLMRTVLEEPGRTATLITPDRTLARRVALACRRWGIVLNDSAGMTLAETGPGVFLLLLAQAVAQELSPVSLLALLKNPLCLALKQDDVCALETFLRSPRPKPGLEALRAHIERQTQTDPALAARALGAWEVIAPIVRQITNRVKFDKQLNLKDIIEVHIGAAEQLSTPDVLWAAAEGEATAQTLRTLLAGGNLMAPVTGHEFPELLKTLLQGIIIHPLRPTHPRLNILGQLEARLIDSDLVILAGLNEGTWPPDPGHDPWMSRPMRAAFGLPLPERAITLAAHDFVQGFCAPQVVLTRAAKIDGAPSIPARWLQRLQVVAQAAQLTLPSPPALHWVRQLEYQGLPQPIRRPEPRPPLEARPLKLSVSDVETWMRDPYALYAKKILRVQALKPLEQGLDAAQRGILLHHILKEFIDTNLTILPDDACMRLVETAQNLCQRSLFDSTDYNFWIREFELIAIDFIEFETKRRVSYLPLATELPGQLNITVDSIMFTLSTRADRLDRSIKPEAPGLALIDYKSGGTYSLKGLGDGRHPQLPLMGLILRTGGFGANAGVDRNVSPSLMLLSFGGGTLKRTALEEVKSVDAINRAEEGLHALIRAFSDVNTPYLSTPDAARGLDYSDYTHLARLAEWGIAESDETGDTEDTYTGEATATGGS